MKALYIFTITLCSLWGLSGCNNEDMADMSPNTPKEASLCLQAPNGETIAHDISELKEETTLMVAKQFGDDYEFTLTSIEYADVNDGFLALINYRLEDGTVSNYAISNSNSVLQATDIDDLTLDLPTEASWREEDNSIIVPIAEGTLSTASTNETKYVCKSATNCTPCQVKIVRDLNLGTLKSKGVVYKVTCRDECSDCKMEVTIEA